MLKKVYDEVATKTNLETANILFEENAKRILNNEEVIDIEVFEKKGFGTMFKQWLKNG